MTPDARTPPGYCIHLIDPDTGYKCNMGLNTSSDRCMGDLSIPCLQRKLVARQPPAPPALAELEKIENFACACCWSNAPDCPGQNDGEMICDGCDRFEYADPEDLRNYIKERTATIREQAQQHTAGSREEKR